jgi:hypothetical protein
MNSSPRPWSIRQLARGEVIPSPVVESWLASYRRSPWAGAVPNNLYDAVYSDTIRQLVERGAALWLAHNPSRPDHILGYLCSEVTSDGVPVVHFAFVKDLYRRQGIAASLFEAAGINPATKYFYTFKTGAEKHFPGGRYQPAIARRKVA